MAATANTSLELGLGLHCSHEVITRPSRQSCLSKIKPQMIRQVLKHGCFSDAEFCCPETRHEACESFGLSPAFKMKELELFPQQTGFSSSSIPNSSPNAFTEQEIMDLDIQMGIPNSVKATYFQSPCNQSSSQLTIFYNGTINVYDVPADKAEAIIMLAERNSNGNTVEQPLSSTRSRLSVSNPPVSAHVTNQSQPLQMSHSELPMAKKLSLQRFLQRRKDRVHRIAVPYRYTTSSK